MNKKNKKICFHGAELGISKPRASLNNLVTVHVLCKDLCFRPCCLILTCQLCMLSGVDVSANQATDEIEDTEIFQMEFDKATETWALRASTNKYWCLQTNTGTVQATRAET